MLTLARSLWRLPAPPDARPAGRWDYAFVAAVAVMAVLEATVLRPDLDRRWLSLAAFLVWLPTLLLRRTRPGVMVTVFAVVMFVPVYEAFESSGRPPDDLHTGIVALLIPYSITRWESGRAVIPDLFLFGLVAARSLLWEGTPTGDRVGGTAVIVAAAAMGAAVRARAMLQSRQLDVVRQQERERLARDLHDTVAHHLTAIAISAQAGLAVADAKPEAARDALRRIDEEATRTLAETRKVVRMLRTDEDEVDRPLDDLAGLASTGGPGPSVDVQVADGLDDLSPTVGAALQRIAQEAVANARRHADGATSVHVQVRRHLDDVELVVTDDGRAPTRSAEGFGIVGMTERAALLGGTLAAGPAPDGGWRVTATLPSEERR
ncbi:signal transduction histidine kinase [Nocardioides sp. BE266]|uniref:sensor histidine kinase n=1 Tax=Nocardioides sp. BE266 TaxID=2817725 RepID=UPI00285CEB3D|nr:sensor histidine kinase [Nocardioides sp. BE266]MDR7253489.1 signal transduction histidine kinase [Nocardioides sp. BE266]